MIWYNTSAPLNEENEKAWQKMLLQNEMSLEIIDITDDLASDCFLAELRKAEHEFIDSYVRMSYFLVKWPSMHLDKTPEMRRRVMGTLLSRGLVELYNAADGELAIRGTFSY